MKFRVQVNEYATDEPRGFLGRDDDDNPNNDVKVAEFDFEAEADQAVRDEIARDESAARELVFHVIDEDGTIYDTTYYDQVYKSWETF